MAGKIVTIAQQKGGTGKTTLTTHLAVAWAQRQGDSVAILDTDPQGSLGQWLEKRERLLGETATGLEFRTASGWGARREARALAWDYDLVVIDTPPHADREMRTAMDAADLIVIPLQPTPVDLWSTKETLDLASKERTAAILVLNRVPARARLTDEVIATIRELEAEIAKARLGNRVAFAASIGAGRTVLKTQGNSRAADEVRALAKELLMLAAS